MNPNGYRSADQQKLTAECLGLEEPDVAADAEDRVVHVFDDVGASERTEQLSGKTEAGDRRTWVGDSTRYEDLQIPERFIDSNPIPCRRFLQFGFRCAEPSL